MMAFIIPYQAAATEEALSVLLTDDSDAVNPGGALTHRLVIRNNSHEDISGVRVVMRVPEFLVPSATA